MAAVYKRELRSLFGGILGWAVIAGVLLVFGIYTAVLSLSKGYADFSLVPFNARFVYLIAVPLITMRTLSEERRQHTDQLLYSSSLSSYQIVLGKYFAIVTIIAIPIALSCIYPAVLASYGRVTLTTAYSSMAAFFMMGTALCAAGLYFSSISQNQFVSAAISFGALIICYFANELQTLFSSGLPAAVIFFTVLAVALGAVMRVMTKSWGAALLAFAVPEIILLAVYALAPSVLDGSVAAAISSVAVFSRLETFCNGIFDIPALIYCLSFAWLFVFFSIQAFEKRRWS